MTAVVGTADVAVATAPNRPSARHRTWIYRAQTDAVLAFCWVPVYAVAHVLSAGHGAADDRWLRAVVAWTLIASLLHQPITLLLVYGDRGQFALRRALFTWSPVVAVPVIVVAVALHLWLIVPVAAIWNTVHTVQQRYGLCRIYARKSGYGSARLDRALLFSWIGAAILIAGATPSTATQLDRVTLGATNADAVRTLTHIRPYALGLLVPVGLVALGTFAALVRQEWRNRDRANHAKWLYQATTLLLIVGIAVDPLAGLVAWVVAHTVEYVVVVQRTMASRYPTPSASSVLARVGAGRRRWGALAAVLLGFLTLPLIAEGRLPADLYLDVIYTVGVLHFWYDSFIWKMRKPTVAADFGIRPAA